MKYETPFSDWKTDLPTDKGDHVKQLQETILLGICCELLMQEKSATFQGKVAQEKLLSVGSHSNEHSQDMF